ncbi:hypothetical protein PR048_023579 [Dryococelus australis]|uniref:DDE Tnp4 domain-containing protein n=1 Tax=Dryococelus australis TaxID=614101 RepID=A0ABQ9GUH0_9NEOP|nr:hypothetical protein PR048_023579 [Dryococelus australis]
MEQRLTAKYCLDKIHRTAATSAMILTCKYPNLNHGGRGVIRTQDLPSKSPEAYRCVTSLGGTTDVTMESRTSGMVAFQGSRLCLVLQLHCSVFRDPVYLHVVNVADVVDIRRVFSGFSPLTSPSTQLKTSTPIHCSQIYHTSVYLQRERAGGEVFFPYIHGGIPAFAKETFDYIRQLPATYCSAAKPAYICMHVAVSPLSLRLTTASQHLQYLQTSSWPDALMTKDAIIRVTLSYIGRIVPGAAQGGRGPAPLHAAIDLSCLPALPNPGLQPPPPAVGAPTRPPYLSPTKDITSLNLSLADASLFFLEAEDIDELLPEYFHRVFPTSEQKWQKISEEFEETWNSHTASARARMVIENIFGILANLQTQMNLQLKNTEAAVMACCALHNLLRIASPDMYAPFESFDFEDTKSARTVGLRTTSENLVGVLNGPVRNATDKAKQVRPMFVRYFVNEGKVSWQDRIFIQ